METTKKKETHTFELTKEQAARQKVIVDQVNDGNYQPELSILEQQYMEKAMVRQKEGIVKPQVVAGREFKGTSFISKPEAIIFKDFTVGVSHTQTILVTNVSFSFNSFKLLPLEDKIKDFFHIQYTPSGRMSAGLSTTITITFTPQLNTDINSSFPILSETGKINIPLICTCKKALIEVENVEIDFGNVIFGEQQTKYLTLKNTGALPTKIYIKTNDGKTIQFFGMDDLKKREQQQKQYANAIKNQAEKEAEFIDRKNKKEQDLANLPEGADPPAEEEEEQAPERDPLLSQLESISLLTEEEIEFEEFLAQVQFKRTTAIEGYSETKIEMTFIPYKLTTVEQDFTLFFENQDYTEPIPISIRGFCVNVPIYVEKEEYNLNVLIYEQFYRQKIILHNRSQNSMKIQLFFPKDFKQYLEFNPTLGYIQGRSHFEIWLKFRPDRSILQTCQKYLVRQDETLPPKDEFEEFTMRIPIKVVGANQVLPIKFNILCCFSVNAITFSPPLIDFGNVFNQSASKATIFMENHSLLPQQFSFVRLPKEIIVPTDAGTGNILPGEKYKLDVEYRPSQATAQEESFVYVRMITGKISARELKVPYCVNVSKCPLSTDKMKIEFPALPEEEFSEVVLSLTNNSQKEFNVELVPPNPQLCGLMVNPLVKELPAGKATLVSIKYTSQFRDLTNKTLTEINQAKGKMDVPPGMVKVNKKLQARLEAKKGEAEAANAANADPKKKGAPPPAAKKEEPKKDAKGVKGGPTEEELKAEEDKIKEEAEQAKRDQEAALERNFDRDGELTKLGGKVYNFDLEDQNRRTQHYEWLIPIYYRQKDRDGADVQILYIEARTTTVRRSLIPNVIELDFGEVPVAFKVTQEILIQNVGLNAESMRMEPLTPFGGFSVLNAMRTIRPTQTKPIVVQFEPEEKQIYEERVVIYSDSTMVSVNLKGIGVKPEVSIFPEDGMLKFSNVFVNETSERDFEIENVSNFPINFKLESVAAGVENLSKQRPFLLIPSEGTVPPKEKYKVTIIFQPDHDSNDYFDVLLIDIPNQLNPKSIYLRGWASSRQFFARENYPFQWKHQDILNVWKDFSDQAKAIEHLKKKYEEPLRMLHYGSPSSENRQKIFLEFSRDEAVENIVCDGTYDEFEKSKNRTRSIVLANSRLIDTKMEKAGNYEINPPAGAADKFFECDVPKGTVQGGTEQDVKFKFNPPESDQLLKDIKALKGIGQWVESVWELKLIGGFVEPGQPDPVIVDVILRAYVEQI